jgi:hypothetical protein
MTELWPILAVAVAVAVLTAFTVWATRGVTLHWGRPGTGAQVRMSTPGKACFAALVWSMLGLIAAGSAGVPHARWLLVPLWGAVIGGAIAAALDARAQRRSRS